MTAPGWYPDPLGDRPLRWFDGDRWTDHLTDDGAPTPGAQAIESVPPEPERASEETVARPTLPRPTVGPPNAAVSLSPTLAALVDGLAASASAPVGAASVVPTPGPPAAKVPRFPPPSGPPVAAAAPASVLGGQPTQEPSTPSFPPPTGPPVIAPAPTSLHGLQTAHEQPPGPSFAPPTGAPVRLSPSPSSSLAVSAPTGPSQAAATHVSLDGSAFKTRHPLAPICLSLLTLGLYGLYWYYAINKELKAAGERVDPGASLLAITLGAFLLVPPVISLYNTCERIRRVQERHGVAAPISSGLAVVLLFIPIVNFFQSAYLQSNLNKAWARIGES